MEVHALIHTTEVVLNRQYIPLELGYVDVTGYEIFFQVTSSYSYSEVIKLYPYARPDAIMMLLNGTPLVNILHIVYKFVTINYSPVSSHGYCVWLQGKQLSNEYFASNQTSSSD
ncbi:hypothetical protein TNIN_18451 [Trichonephila inaurata madagascariensis]|uniref:Uncharacterized protein n=1 Tax=Trichonephila inaurata madagascariensis TaxID=2747483 RepID=A0A8X6X817_9ARAC|nr:hypothetical protein TNIN_18451 [Trichonephila inaurata madagascariensis]